MRNWTVFALSLVVIGLLLPFRCIPYWLWLEAIHLFLKLRNAFLIRGYRFLDEDLILLKNRISHWTRFLASCFHRPPPVVGRPRNVNSSDRHKGIGWKLEGCWRLRTRPRLFPTDAEGIRAARQTLERVLSLVGPDLHC